MGKENGEEITTEDPTADNAAEPAADPTAEETTAVETEDPTAEPDAEAGPKPKPAAAAPDTNAALASALQELNRTLAQPKITPEQQEAAWARLEEQTGKTRQQIMFDDQRTRDIATMTNLETSRELGKMRAEKILGEEHADLLPEIEKVMAGLAPAVQGNPKAWEDAVDMAIGRKKRMTKKTSSAAPTRKVVSGGAPTTKGSPAAPKKELKQYTAMEQALINRQFGGKSEEYEKYKSKGSTATDSDVKYSERQGGNNADAELVRLTSGNS